ncbi:MAG: hypothetical protein Q8S03_09605 [Brevundimonas sp.]|uniref:hypothetical protein n=1 Tax=Brevundimonas sp. TaxID=1871086 RepID=UPI00273326D2|nr:hypothetical protein [Brevundimonas sp.]MDP3404935.1 hypothetical protein [Brevundimonas sp.]
MGYCLTLDWDGTLATKLGLAADTEEDDGVLGMIGNPSTTELTQGTIFTCAASEDYSDAAPRGLVITARCDVAHGKAPVISYVPLISFRAWLFRDGLRLLASRVVAANRGSMRAALRDAGLVDSILDTLSPQTVREHLAGLKEKSEQKAAERYSVAEVQKQAAEAAIDAMPQTDRAADLFNSQAKEYQRILQDLLSNGISDYHFIERSEAGEQCEGYVALLREIRYLPVALATELQEGIDLTRFVELCRDHPRYSDKLIIVDRDQYAMPVGVLQSPFIELFMQRFTNLYARIGVTDFSPELMKSLRGIVPFHARDDSTCLSR